MKSLTTKLTARILTLIIGCFLVSNLASAECGHISAIKIYDQTTDQEVPGIGPITNGMNIDVNLLPANYYLTVETEGIIESVRMVCSRNRAAESARKARVAGPSVRFAR